MLYQTLSQHPIFTWTYSPTLQLMHDNLLLVKQIQTQIKQCHFKLATGEISWTAKITKLLHQQQGRFKAQHSTLHVRYLRLWHNIQILTSLMERETWDYHRRSRHCNAQGTTEWERKWLLASRHRTVDATPPRVWQQNTLFQVSGSLFQTAQTWANAIWP